MATLYHVHDPMCSWCWAFRPVWSALQQQLPDDLLVEKLVGGLAPDSDQPMAPTMQQKLQQIWQQIEQVVPGTQFNFDFWQINTPRRSTYPACRAVIAAESLQTGCSEAMTLAIQRAYYLHARNPSDDPVLADLASQILDIEPAQFLSVLRDQRTEQQLQRELARARALPIQGFPSLVLEQRGHYWPIPLDYRDPGPDAARHRANAQIRIARY